MGESWAILSPIEQSIKRKIEAVGKPLKEWDVKIYRGILTGCNEAFIIDGAKKEELIAKAPKSAEIIRPILRGRDIKRYGYNFADLWIIATFPSRNYDIDKYQAVKKHLLSFGMERLEQTGKSYIINGKEVNARKKTNNKWFETQDSIGYWEDFNKQKIVWKRVGSILRFALDNVGYMCLDSTCFAIGKDINYLVCFLNSNIGNYLLQSSPQTGTGDLLISVQAIEPILVPPEYDSTLFNDIIKNINIDTKGLEDIINIELYKYYKLNENEINFIEQKLLK